MSRIGLSPFATKALPQQPKNGHYNEQGVFIPDGIPFKSARGKWRVIKPGKPRRNVPATDPNAPAKVGAGGIPPSPFGSGATAKAPVEMSTKKRFSPETLQLGKEVAAGDENLSGIFADALEDDGCPVLADLSRKKWEIGWKVAQSVILEQFPNLPENGLAELFEHTTEEEQQRLFDKGYEELRANMAKYSEYLVTDGGLHETGSEALSWEDLLPQAKGNNADPALYIRSRLNQYVSRYGSPPDVADNIRRIAEEMAFYDDWYYENKVTNEEKEEARKRTEKHLANFRAGKLKSIGLSPFTKAVSRRTQGGHYDNSGNFIRDGTSFRSERSGECRVIQPTSHRNVPSAGCGTSTEAPDEETELGEETSERANVSYLQEMMKFLAEGEQLPEDLLEDYMEEWEKCDDAEKEELTRYFMELKEGPPTETGGTEDLGELYLPKNTELRFENEQAEMDYKEILGNIPLELLGAMCNAQDGADIMVEHDIKHGGVYVNVVDPETRYEAARHFSRNSDGELIVANEAFGINDELPDGSPNPLKGTGTEIFANQVLALKQAKAKTIITHAAGSKNSTIGLNGFYTWPRAGFSGNIPEDAFRKLSPTLRGKMGKSREILDLYALPGGKEDWYEHGRSIACTFDLTDGSRNMKVLEAYMKERRERDA